MDPASPDREAAAPTSERGTPRRALAVSGWQASGKTTLLVHAIGELRRRGLSVAVVKHDAHGIALDVEGKDSDRLFHAGAEVVLDGAEERFQRSHPAEREPVEELLRRLERRHDLVLVEGYRELPVARVWLAGEDGAPPPAGMGGLVAVLPREGREKRFLELVLEHLRSAWERTAVRVVSAGATSALPIAPGLSGALGELLTALRWDPDAAWILPRAGAAPLPAGCVAWLRARRRPGCWAVLPRIDGTVQVAPALYEPQAATLLAELARRGEQTPARLADAPRIRVEEPPAEILGSWPRGGG